MVDKLSTPLDEFKEREIEIINLMADGSSNQEIADQLFITKETVRWYNKQIYSKLGTSRRTEAVALAREFGLIGDAVDASPQSIKHKLPITTGPFIGRDNEISELSGLLQNPDVRLLSIIATGGMGKSRISLELGHLIKNDYEHGAVFIDLSPLRKPDDIASLVVENLGLNINNDLPSRETLFNYCREKELLLIFDNFEHVLSGAGLLSEILEIAPGVTIIATSRERLNLRVETVFYLQAIIEHADKLFIEVALMMRPNIDIREGEEANIQKIVELVGGLPLALVLAATWIDTLSVAEIAEEIERNLDFLSAEMGDMPERQRSIHAVIDPTWKRLSLDEQNAFMRASVFRGGLTRATFQGVTGASVRTLQTLLSRSLISHGYGRRYDMHPLLRQYAREKLEESQLLSEAKKVHLETFLNYAKEQNERMYSGYYLESVEALDIEQDNFRAAIDWSFKGHEVDTGVSLLLSLCNFWSIRSQSFLALDYLEQALQHREIAPLYSELSRFQSRLGQTENLPDTLRKALTLAREQDSLEVLATAYRRMGTNYLFEDPDEAQHFLEKSLELALETGNKQIIADTYTTLGVFTSHNPSGIELALEYNENALDLYEELGDLRGISMTTYNVSTYYRTRGKIQEARELCEYSLTLKHQIGDKAGIARRLSVLAGWDIDEEEFETASERLNESFAICEELGELSRLVYTMIQQGLLQLIMNNYSQARNIFERGLQIALESNNLYHLSDIFNFLSLLSLLQNRLQEAYSYIVKAIEADAKIKTSVWLSVVSYANYLQYSGKSEECLPIASTLYHHIHSYGAGYATVNKYFVHSMIYRIQQEFGDEAWEAAIKDSACNTLEQIFQGIVDAIA